MNQIPTLWVFPDRTTIIFSSVSYRRQPALSYLTFFSSSADRRFSKIYQSRNCAGADRITGIIIDMEHSQREVPTVAENLQRQSQDNHGNLPLSANGALPMILPSQFVNEARSLDDLAQPIVDRERVPTVSVSEDITERAPKVSVPEGITKKTVSSSQRRRHRRLNSGTGPNRKVSFRNSLKYDDDEFAFLSHAILNQIQQDQSSTMGRGADFILDVIDDFWTFATGEKQKPRKPSLTKQDVIDFRDALQYRMKYVTPVASKDEEDMTVLTREVFKAIVVHGYPLLKDEKVTDKWKERAQEARHEAAKRYEPPELSSSRDSQSSDNDDNKRKAKNQNVNDSWKERARETCNETVARNESSRSNAYKELSDNTKNDYDKREAPPRLQQGASSQQNFEPKPIHIQKEQEPSRRIFFPENGLPGYQSPSNTVNIFSVSDDTSNAPNYGVGREMPPKYPQATEGSRVHHIYHSGSGQSDDDSLLELEVINSKDDNLECDHHPAKKKVPKDWKPHVKHDSGDQEANLTQRKPERKSDAKVNYKITSETLAYFEAEMVVSKESSQGKWKEIKYNSSIPANSNDPTVRPVEIVEEDESKQIKKEDKTTNDLEPRIRRKKILSEAKKVSTMLLMTSNTDVQQSCQERLRRLRSELNDLSEASNFKRSSSCPSKGSEMKNRPRRSRSQGSTYSSSSDNSRSVPKKGHTMLGTTSKLVGRDNIEKDYHGGDIWKVSGDSGGRIEAPYTNIDLSLMQSNIESHKRSNCQDSDTIAVVAPASLHEKIETKHQDETFTTSKVSKSRCKRGKASETDTEIRLISSEVEIEGIYDALGGPGTSAEFGGWKSEEFDLFQYGPLHPTVVNALFCPLVALGQIMVRMRTRWAFLPKLGRRRREAFLVAYILTMLFVVVNCLLYYLPSRATSMGWMAMPYMLKIFLVVIFNGGFAAYFILNVISIRRRLRQRYRIKKSKYGPCEDVIMGFGCAPCVLVQMLRQTADYESCTSYYCTPTGLPEYIEVEVPPSPTDSTIPSNFTHFTTGVSL